MSENIFETVAEILYSLYPKTSCFLNHNGDWQLLFAVILSAQTSDVKVNEVTKVLFEKYPDLLSLSNAGYDDVKEIIKPLGLSDAKAGYVISTAKMLVEKYDGRIPEDRETLMSFPGVGYKTSGVVLAELFDYPYIPVDTHVKRVSERIGLVPVNTKTDEIERLLETGFSDDAGTGIHRRLILFGRNVCTSKKPACETCPMKEFCSFVIKK